MANWQFANPGWFWLMVLVPLPWLLFTHIVHPLGRDFLPLTPAMFVAHAGRLPHIATFFALQMLAFKSWSLLWVVLAGALLLVARRLTPSGRGLLLLLLGQLGMYVVAFVFSDWQPYTAHVQTSLDRLLMQTVPLALLLLVEATSALTAERATTTERVSTPARGMWPCGPLPDSRRSRESGSRAERGVAAR